MSQTLRSAFVSRTLAAALLSLALASPQQALASNGAVMVDDTDVDPVGHCKVDSWASFASNQDPAGSQRKWKVWW